MGPFPKMSNALRRYDQTASGVTHLGKSFREFSHRIPPPRSANSRITTNYTVSATPLSPMLEGANCHDNKRSQREGICRRRDLGNFVLLSNKNSCWRIPPESPRITFVPPPSAAGDFAKAVLAGSDRSSFGRPGTIRRPLKSLSSGKY